MPNFGSYAKFEPEDILPLPMDQLPEALVRLADPDIFRKVFYYDISGDCDMRSSKVEAYRFWTRVAFAFGLKDLYRDRELSEFARFHDELAVARGAR